MSAEPTTEELTAAQIAAVDAQVERRLRLWAKGIVIAFGILFAGNGYALYSNSVDNQTSTDATVKSGRVVSVAGCNRDFDTISKLRDLLTQASDSVERNNKLGLYTHQQYTQARDFYAKQLASLTLPDCRKSKSVVTDNPSKIGPVPVPRYPGDPADRAAHTNPQTG